MPKPIILVEKMSWITIVGFLAAVATVLFCFPETQFFGWVTLIGILIGVSLVVWNAEPLVQPFVVYLSVILFIAFFGNLIWLHVAPWPQPGLLAIIGTADILFSICIAILILFWLLNAIGLELKQGLRFVPERETIVHFSRTKNKA
jgi:hypothetical protein